LYVVLYQNSLVPRLVDAVWISIRRQLLGGRQVSLFSSNESGPVAIVIEDSCTHLLISAS